DVAGPDLDEVLVLEEAGERAVESARPLLGLDGQVRPGDVADEERVAGQEQPRRLVAASVLDDEGEVLGPVAGRAEGGDARLAEAEGRTLLERLVVVRGAGLRAHVERRAGRGGEAPASREVVGVVVRLKDVPDLEVVLVRELEVVVDLPLGVDDRRLAAVGDHVRRTAKVFVQHLAEEHLLRRALEPPAPRLAGGASLRRGEEVLERDVDERGARLGKRRVAVEELAPDADAAPAARLDPRADEQLRVDRNRMAIADEDPRRHGREAIPGGEESAGLVEEGGDEPTVDDPRPALGSLPQVDLGLAQLPALDLR